MGIAAQTPMPYSEHHKLIDKLYATISTVPSSTMDPAVINYILFPITNIMRQSNPASLPDNFLEAAFNLLAFMVGAWRKCDGGIDVVAWEQLWRFSISAVGPRVVSREKDKGKGKEAGQEVQLNAVKLLAALLEPSTENTPTLHPSPAMLEKVANSKSPLLPTLFQTITLLLETVLPSPPYLQLQLSSLRLLRRLIQSYLPGKHQILAALLPGTVSAMAKLIDTQGKNLKGEAAQESAGVIEIVVTLTLNDHDLQELGVLRPPAEDLSQLAEEWEAANISADQLTPPSPAPSNASIAPNPFPPLTASYLSFTATQLLSAIPPVLFTLVPHSSDLARSAASSLASSLIGRCSESLPLLRSRALTCLLLLSQDTFDPVRYDARRKLRQLLSTETSTLSLTLVDLLSDAVNSLPRLVTSQQDTRVDEIARLVTAIAEASTELSRSRKHSLRGNAIAELLGPNGSVERWSWALLDCLEFGKPSGWSAAAGTAERAARLGWEGGFSQNSNLLLVNGAVQEQAEDEVEAMGSFPHLPLRYIESEATARRMGEMLSALGSAADEAALHSVEYFIKFAKTNRRRHTVKAVSSLWVADRLLSGVVVSQLEGVEGKVSKATRKMAREVVKAVIAMEEDGEEEEEDFAYDQEDTSALIPIERTKGIDTLTTLLDRNPLPNSRTATETRRLHLQAQQTLLTSLSLQSLSLSAHILSSSFRPLLLTMLYIILSHLASPHPIVQSYASLTLSHVAQYTGYASPAALVLDNVDYVINVVTQRLTYKRLSATAPLVLIAMIRLVGEPIVPLVHDVVDEIFDALDDYHGYETMTSSLLAVLVILIDVMSKKVKLEVEGSSDEERKRKAEKFSRIGKAPDPASDFAEFGKWWEEKAQRSQETVSEVLERAPQHAWGKEEAVNEDQDETTGEDDAKMEEVETPATRSQQVATRILTKALFFLTHRSPFLRSKVLSLIADSVPILALGNRESDLLPLIHDSWSIILNRLDDPEPYVVVEAAEVIASLCEHVGDFMSKRVLEHAWPRLLKLLNDQRELDRRSALARRGGMGTESSFTVSHRLHIAILNVAIFIAREVPVADKVLWEMMLSFRDFVDDRVHEDLCGKAMQLYTELGKRDGDALWIVLNGTLGNGVVGDAWEYLSRAKLSIERCASILLGAI
ncbi:hypothetical protein I305_06385 [Cryptococcus gattii E566]|uniref:TEL2-interacting protein 1 n=1 Tax=Cryptococcus gattii EJB2 TaxID=1296103 RepID=A0ABR5BMJ9_9TREE|nr:hypothetical protein I306_06140 [Cryptococcus gattii EJB2]KIY31276.1 hypothetical protein I305_06385 [Cryptococcus gattii E566]KJE02286.1 hypothetical protein I311_04056 [Cryptococcus gattii NT-10]